MELASEKPEVLKVLTEASEQLEIANGVRHLQVNHGKPYSLHFNS